MMRWLKAQNGFYFSVLIQERSDRSLSDFYAKIVARRAVSDGVHIAYAVSYKYSE
jgi:hypothetical protein